MRISLSASAKGEKITSQIRNPLDIVLVLDQSGSMADEYKNGITYLDKLKESVTGFTSSILNDAKENNLDHRIAIVGFGMQNQYNSGSEYYQYLNTEVLTTGGAPVTYKSLSKNGMNEVYKNALVPAGISGELNSVISAART